MKKLLAPLFAVALLLTSCGSNSEDKEAVILLAAESLEEDMGVYSVEYAECLLDGINELVDVSWSEWRELFETDGTLENAPGAEDVEDEVVLELAMGCMQEGDMFQLIMDAALEEGFSDDGPMQFGDDPYFDELYTECENGDGEACNVLYWESPLDSEYEAFGLTCAGRFDC